MMMGMGTPRNKSKIERIVSLYILRKTSATSLDNLDMITLPTPEGGGVARAECPDQKGEE
jgi:hypothetical protein